MSAFTSNIYISPQPKSNKRITTKELIYDVWFEWSSEKVIVPAWFEFDWATVPMIFGQLIQRVEPRTINAACIHDYIYIHLKHRYTRSQADNIFLEALIACKVNKFKALMMYLWVRLWWRLYR